MHTLIYGKRVPSWYTPNKAAARLNHNVALGRHPIGLRLLNPEWLRELDAYIEAGESKELVERVRVEAMRETCRNCAHMQRVYLGRAYYKCAKARQTRGPATDIRLKWPACELWKAR